MGGLILSPYPISYRNETSKYVQDELARSPLRLIAPDVPPPIDDRTHSVSFSLDPTLSVH